MFLWNGDWSNVFVTRKKKVYENTRKNTHGFKTLVKYVFVRVCVLIKFFPAFRGSQMPLILQTLIY